MENGPVAREMAFERGEDLPLGVRGIGVRPRGKHPGHQRFIPRSDSLIGKVHRSWLCGPVRYSV
jgi:hypothetical protein